MFIAKKAKKKFINRQKAHKESLLNMSNCSSGEFLFIKFLKFLNSK